MSKPILWIVIPCYNEEQVLPITAPLFLKKINDLSAAGLVSEKSRVLFVNDGSRDATWSLIQKFASEDDHFIGISQHLFLSFPSLSDFVNDTHVTEKTLTYLFSVDDDNYFLLNEAPEEIPEDYEFNTVRELRNLQIGPKYRTFAAITGLHLYNWYRTNRFCGCCGHKTVHSSTERALKCPSCGHLIYPRIVPAVIVGVKNDDKILLTKYRKGFTPFALIAGFTEIGETLEETVAREVMEEAGIRVKNIQYYKSQPWGVVDDLLAGFYCEVDGDTEIHMDASELKLAEWKSRDEIELQPNDFSLTNEMMRAFKEGKF